MTSGAPILIAGGGIGGLALALALAQRGRNSVVLERQEAFAQAGAGIQIGPNGVRALQRLGLADGLQPSVGQPEAIEVFEGASARQLTRLPLGNWIAGRHGAPYWVAHRGDLHRVLLEAASADPRIAIRTGFAVASLAQTATDVTVSDPAGAALTGCVLIGADGLWSAVRHALFPDAAPHFAGATATRTVLPAAQAGRLSVTAVGLWLGPEAHIVHYPVRGGSELAVVVIARAAGPGDGHARDWDAEADAAALLRRLGRFHAGLTDVLARAAGSLVPWRRWALHAPAPLPQWMHGRVALMGDAAHPMLPYLAQGGALAMEDAIVLADCLADGPHGARDVSRALLRYQSLRHARASRVQAASRRQGRIYRLSPPLSWARNAVLRVTPAQRLMAGFDWLYDWRPPASPSPLRGGVRGGGIAER